MKIILSSVRAKIIPADCCTGWNRGLNAARASTAGFPRRIARLALLAAGLVTTAAANEFRASLTASPSGQIDLRWPSETGKSYSIETSADLLTWSPQPGDLAGTGAELGQTVVAAGTAEPKKQFWRVIASGWSPLKVGAGGWITGIDASVATTTGPLYAIRTDTYGGYVGNPNAGTPWRQVVTANTMPASGIGQPGESEGVYEIRIAPSDCNRLYMTYRKMIFRSNDAGQTWSATAFTHTNTMDPNDAYRMWGEKMAVDPANPDVVYAGTPASGLFVTTNGGAAWSAVAGFPVATSAAGVTGIVFDPSSGTTAGKTKTIYAVSNGNGVYQTTNGGASWSALGGGPTTVTHAAIGTDGVYYAVNMTTHMYRYQNGAWATSADSTIQLHSITTDPFNPARIICGRDSGHLVISTDHGATWGSGVIWTVKRQANDVPWLANANEAYMSNGGMRFDPVVHNKLWFGDGSGSGIRPTPPTPRQRPGTPTVPGSSNSSRATSAFLRAALTSFWRDSIEVSGLFRGRTLRTHPTTTRWARARASSPRTP